MDEKGIGGWGGYGGGGGAGGVMLIVREQCDKVGVSSPLVFVGSDFFFCH